MPRDLPVADLWRYLFRCELQHADLPYLLAQIDPPTLDLPIALLTSLNEIEKEIAESPLGRKPSANS